MSVLVCDGCGRVAGEREVYCGACGRLLPGRSVAEPDTAPPGWLVAPTARDRDGPFFEPLPPVAVAVEPGPAAAAPRVPAYRILSQERPDGDGRRAYLPAPPLPLGGVDAPASGAVAAAPPPLPALRALLLPLVVLAVGSSAAAVALLVLHLLRDR